MQDTSWQAALSALLQHLGAQGYSSTAATPETHEKVTARRKEEARRAGSHLTGQTLVDVFGWSLAIERDALDALEMPQKVLDVLFEQREGLWRPLVRISSLYPPGSQVALDEPELANILYAHSPWPSQSSSVFLGPGAVRAHSAGQLKPSRSDTYRFLDFVFRALRLFKPPDGGLAVDVGTGGGAGALLIRHSSSAETVIGLDINPSALRFAEVNRSSSTSAPIQYRQSDLLSALTESERGQLNLVVSNPPYIAGAISTYADGGDEHGLALPWRIVVDALASLQPNGLMLLYTGVPIDVQGNDPLKAKYETELEGMKSELLRYEVLDVDVFGDELGSADNAYGGSNVGRIAVVGCVLRKKA